MNRIHCIPPFARKRTARSVAVAMVVALLPGTAVAEAARVTFSHGPVTAIDADGVRRTLARGADIDAGDTIDTGKRGRAQLRFTDGSFMSLRPDTEFRVDEYEFKARKPTEQKGFFSLLRGGLRTITGLIGRARKAGYRMRTSTATIGIRGTEYSLGFDADTGLMSWTVANDGKSSISVVLGDGTEQIVSAGGAGKATPEQFEQLRQALQALADEGKLEDGVSPEDLLEVFAAADLIPPQPADLPLPLPPLPPLPPPPEEQAPAPTCTEAMPCAFVAAFGAHFDEGYGGGGVIADGGEGAAVMFESEDGGALTSYSYPGDEYPQPQIQSGRFNTAQAVEDGTAYFSVDPANRMDPRTIATWGRWIAPSGGNGRSAGSSPHPLVFEQHSPDPANPRKDTFAYVVSIPTQPEDLYTVGTAEFSVVGFTPPAVLGERGADLGAAGTVTGTGSVNFMSGRLDVNLNIPFANGAYDLAGNNLQLNNRLNPSAAPVFFNSMIGGSVVVTGGIQETACVEGCSGSVAGNLFGPRADGMAAGYKVHDYNLNSDVTGATVLQQDSCENCEIVPGGGGQQPVP